MLVDHRGNAKVVVIGVGGFLGVGERNIAVPFTQLRWQANTANTTRPANGQQQAAQDTDHPTRAILPGAEAAIAAGA